ncbi:MAG: response regulator, partial [Bdellovibrionales bacterium]|nr:response regulator [Bdellovibrionales bacterium]
QLRQRWEGVELKIIAVTANAGPDAQERYRRAGMNGFLSKPIAREALLLEIARVLG